MSEVNPKNIHVVGSVPELLEAVDAEDLQEEIAAEVDDMSLLTEPVIKEVLERTPGEYVWDYIPPEYTPIEVKIFELPVTTWSDVSGVTIEELPEICPYCESEHQFRVIENSKNRVFYNARDGDFYHDEILETRYSTVTCPECDGVIVEDGEPQF